MGPVRTKLARRVQLVAIVTSVCAIALACAPQYSGPPAPTTPTTMTIPWSTPTGQWSFFNMTCWVEVLGTYYSFPQSASVNVNAPATVAQGTTFDMVVAPGPFVVPTEAQGYALTAMTAFTIRFPLSPNLLYVDAVMSQGFNMGPGYPNVSVNNGQLYYHIPGPFVPGSTVQMPLVRLTVTATGDPGSTIQTRMDLLTNTASFEAGAVGTNCYLNDPNLVFWTTTIV